MTDPRRTSKGNYRHKLSDIILLVLSAVLCGHDDWDEIAQFGREQEVWLRQYGEFVNGIPSHDTINRVFSKVDPEEFSHCFIRWINTLRRHHRKEVIAIDGKRVKNSGKKGIQSSALHIVSALATECNLCLGQVPTDKKSNEITAIPQLLSLLDIEGDIVSIDAMGCQKKIAKQIKQENNADYILAVKENQKMLEEGIRDTIRFIPPKSEHQQTDFGHGRIETRKCRVYTDFTYIENSKKWTGLSCVVEIEAERIIKSTGATSKETRLYISSIKATAKEFNKWIRSHWAVENKLHWVLDVVFREDLSTKRKGHAAENFNTILKTVITLLYKEDNSTTSYKRKRKKAALNLEYRQRILNL